MIKTCETVDSSVFPDLSFIAPEERICFFDIETTGLKAGKSSLYLIGILDRGEDGWQLWQYFAESMLDEQELLCAFSGHIDAKRTGGAHPVLITFNGDTFDIPYLRETAREYHLPDPFRDTRSYDLFRMLRPYKKLTGLPDLKMKSVEKLCGIFREDKYTGGELIYVYEEYLRLASILPGGCEDTDMNRKLRENCLSCLLLHNAEDVKDMPRVVPVSAYQRLMEGDFSLEHCEVKDGILDLSFRLGAALPKELYLENGEYVVSVSGEDPLLFEVTAALFEGELRYFYQDYKNYYYLPLEDMAVHKSVGEFVDKKSRRQATACTCYVKRRGTFLPEPAPVFTPVFYKSYKGEKYGEITGETLSDEGKLKAYALAVIQSFA